MMWLQVDCSTVDGQLSELFGRGSREGILHWVRDGTVLLNNVHQVNTRVETMWKDGYCRA